MSTVPVPEHPRPDKSRTPLLIFLAAFVVLAGLGIASLVKTMMTAGSDAKPVAEKFLTAIEKKDYQAAGQQISPRVKDTASKEQIADIVEVLEKRRGKMTGHSGPTGFNMNTYNGVTQATFGYTITFAKGETTARITLIKEADGWRVLSYNYQL